MSRIVSAADGGSQPREIPSVARRPGWPPSRILSLLASVAAISVVVAAPVLLSLGRAESAALYAAFSPLCHQAAERSWTVLGYPLAVCVRCFGFYCGVFGAFCVGAKFSWTGFWAATAAAFATVTLETTSVLAAPPGIRFLSGAWLGLAMASALSEGAVAVGVVRKYRERLHSLGSP